MLEIMERTDPPLPPPDLDEVDPQFWRTFFIFAGGLAIGILGTLSALDAPRHG